MIEHLLLGDMAALLIVLGLTAPMIAPMTSHPPLRPPAHPRAPRDRVPAVGGGPLRLARPDALPSRPAPPPVHALQHAMFLGFGINMWMCLFGPLPMPAWFGNLGKLIYIVAVRLTGAVLGNIFLWSGTVFYSYYLHGDAVYNISPLADQSIAGAIMMVEESLLTLGLFCWLFLRAAREGGTPGAARLSRT